VFAGGAEEVHWASTVMSDSFGSGGANATLVFERYQRWTALHGSRRPAELSVVFQGNAHGVQLTGTYEDTRVYMLALAADFML